MVRGGMTILTKSAERAIAAARFFGPRLGPDVKYASQACLASLATKGAPAVAVEALINAVRLPNGRLQDDVGVAVCQETE
jgi:hypothetical protein